MSQVRPVETSALNRVVPMILVEEISHRVVNEYTQAIACLGLSAAGLASVEAREALMGAATQLRNFAEAHRALQRPVSDEAVDVGEYLARLCAASMAAGLHDRGVRLSLSCDAIHLSAQHCWRVALIVAELVTNSVRHGLRGGPGQVTIHLVDNEEAVACRVSDDGTSEPISHAARGLSVVKALAADLEGDVIWRFGVGGTTAVLTFPKTLERRSA